MSLGRHLCVWLSLFAPLVNFIFLSRQERESRRSGRGQSNARAPPTTHVRPSPSAYGGHLVVVEKTAVAQWLLRQSLTCCIIAITPCCSIPSHYAMAGRYLFIPPPQTCEKLIKSSSSTWIDGISSGAGSSSSSGEKKKR